MADDIAKKYERFILQDTERQMAVNERIDALANICAAIVCTLHGHKWGMFMEITSILHSALENARRDQAHPAQIAEIDAFLVRLSAYDSEMNKRANAAD